jgi:hypothetical protein
MRDAAPMIIELRPRPRQGRRRRGSAQGRGRCSGCSRTTRASLAAVFTLLADGGEWGDRPSRVVPA